MPKIIFQLAEILSKSARKCSVSKRGDKHRDRVGGSGEKVGEGRRETTPIGGSTNRATKEVRGWW
jgi:hypothetical protein